MTISVEIDIDIASVPCDVERDDASGEFIAYNDDLRVVAPGTDEAEARENFRSAVLALVRYEVGAGRAVPDALASLIRVPA